MININTKITIKFETEEHEDTLISPVTASINIPFDLEDSDEDNGGIYAVENMLQTATSIALQNLKKKLKHLSEWEDNEEIMQEMVESFEGEIDDEDIEKSEGGK